MKRLTPAQVYVSTMHSVRTINRRITMPSPGQSEEDRKDEIARNADHIRIMLESDIWTSEDLTPFRQAVAAADAWIAGQPVPAIDLTGSFASVEQRLQAAEMLINLILDEEGE